MAQRLNYLHQARQECDALCAELQRTRYWLSMAKHPGNGTGTRVPDDVSDNGVSLSASPPTTQTAHSPHVPSSAGKSVGQTPPNASPGAEHGLNPYTSFYPWPPQWRPEVLRSRTHRASIRSRGRGFCRPRAESDPGSDALGTLGSEHDQMQAMRQYFLPSVSAGSAATSDRQGNSLASANSPSSPTFQTQLWSRFQLT